MPWISDAYATSNAGGNIGNLHLPSRRDVSRERERLRVLGSAGIGANYGYARKRFPVANPVVECQHDHGDAWRRGSGGRYVHGGRAAALLIMPGLLNKDARCPKCSVGIAAIVRTTNREGVTAEYFHEREADRLRRRRRCKVWYAAPLTQSQLNEVMQGGRLQ